MPDAACECLCAEHESPVGEDNRTALTEVCDACEGKGWGVFISGIVIAIQRCDSCAVYEDDLAAAHASDIPFVVRNRETGQPCEARRSEPWECVPL